MPGKSNSKKDQTNLEKMKNEMRRKKEKAEKAEKGPVAALIDELTDMPQKPDKEGTAPSYPEEELLVFVEGNLHNKEMNEVLHNVEVGDVELVVFWVGAEQFAFRLKNVREIIKIDDIKKVPHAPAHVAGLCSLRGSILPVVDIRRCLNMLEKEYSDDSRIIVTDIHGANVGIITDGISAVITIKASSILQPPSNIKRNQSGEIDGIVLGDNGKSIIMVLDAENVVKFEQLKKDFMSGKASDRTESFSPSSHHVDEVELVIFLISGEQYALDVRNVKEILRCAELLKVPNSPYYVEGVISVRNHLLAVINLAKLFGTGHCRAADSTRIIVMDAGDISYGIIVDKVSEVARVPRNLFYKPYHIVQNADMQFIREFANLNHGKQVVMVLDPYKLVSVNDLNAIHSDHLACHESGNDLIDEEMSENQCLDQEQIVAFKIDNEEYGVTIDYVCEVNNINEIYSFPGAPDFIEGMVNLRGDIIPVLNLRTFFGISLTNKSACSKLLVVEYKKERLGIMIDSVTEVVRVGRDLLETAARALEAGNKKKYIHQIGKLNEGKRTILMIDLTAILDFVFGR
jgi:purine-binding chemotaxis protein CheW